jgi:hypothetical protein
MQNTPFPQFAALPRKGDREQKTKYVNLANASFGTELVRACKAGTKHEETPARMSGR